MTRRRITLAALRNASGGLSAIGPTLATPWRRAASGEGGVPGDLRAGDHGVGA